MLFWMVQHFRGGTRPGHDATDAAVAQSASGRRQISRQEFAGMFRAASQKLWCIASAILRDPSGADDVVQEAAVVAMGKLHEFDPDSPSTNFTAWMGQIVRYTALNEHRRKRRDVTRTMRPENPGEFMEAETVGAGPRGVDTAVATFDAEVQAALAVLDDVPRSCLVMKTVMNLSYAEIAASLSIPEGTAMSHVCRARKTVRDQITAQRDRLRNAKGGGS